MNRTSLSLALLSAAAFAPAPAFAETISVRTSGELQAALLGAQDGDVIEIRAGTYSAVNAGGAGEGFLLDGKSNLTLRARGRVKIDGGGAVTCLTVTDVAGLTVEGITFQNAGGANDPPNPNPENDGIFMSGVTDFTAIGCTFRNCGDSGIEDRDTDGYTVDDCTFKSCSWGLATGFDGAARNVAIRNSSFKSCGSYGIDLWSSGAVVEDNSFKSCNIAINLRGGFGAVLVRGSSISRGDTGIVADGSSNTIQFNEISRPSDTGILLGDEGGHVCSGNRVSKAGQVGFYVDSAGNDIYENWARKSGELDLGSTFPQMSNTYTDNDFESVEYDLITD